MIFVFCLTLYSLEIIFYSWKKDTIDGYEQWSGVFSNLVWILVQKPNHILYKVYTSDEKCPKINESFEELLQNYFRLEININSQIEMWSLNDSNFRERVSGKMGIRMLSQDLIENLFSFICSSNNNIKRISNMVEKMCSAYGKKICTVENKTFYSFPNASILGETGVQDFLKKEGFGYRAKFIYESAKQISDYGEQKWIEDLKALEYEDARKMLTQLCGVGKKIADCVCLMSLNHLEAIPVDTHIFQIAKIYLPHLSNRKTVTDRTYDEINLYFRKLYGPLAGWAQNIIICVVNTFYFLLLNCGIEYFVKRAANQNDLSTLRYLMTLVLSNLQIFILFVLPIIINTVVLVTKWHKFSNSKRVICTFMMEGTGLFVFFTFIYSTLKLSKNYHIVLVNYYKMINTTDTIFLHQFTVKYKCCIQGFNCNIENISCEPTNFGVHQNVYIANFMTLLTMVSLILIIALFYSRRHQLSTNNVWYVHRPEVFSENGTANSEINEHRVCSEQCNDRNRPTRGPSDEVLVDPIAVDYEDEQSTFSSKSSANSMQMALSQDRELGNLANSQIYDNSNFISRSRRASGF